jgi:hypothetical protein
MGAAAVVAAVEVAAPGWVEVVVALGEYRED